MKKIIRLTESDLHNIINESVTALLREYGEGESGEGQWYINRLVARHEALGNNDRAAEIRKWGKEARSRAYSNAKAEGRSGREVKGNLTKHANRGYEDQQRFMNAVNGKVATGRIGGDRDNRLEYTSDHGKTPEEMQQYTNQQAQRIKNRAQEYQENRPQRPQKANPTPSKYKI